MKKLILPLLLLVAFGMLAAVESAPSEVVGYVKYDCLVGLNYIALPMEAGYTMVSEFADQNMGVFDALNYWDNVNQQWVGAYDFGYWDGDFAVTAGIPLLVNALSVAPIYSIGDMPVANAQYSLLPGLNSLMIPLNKSALTMASELADDIGAGSLDAMNYWDNVNQQWVGAYDFGYWDGDFPVSIGMPLLVNSLVTDTWPAGPRAIVNRNSK